VIAGVRYLVVNADDFGHSPGVNAGVIRAYEEGILTSASLMVRQPAASDAAVYSRRHPQLSVGLHLDLGEWEFDRATGDWKPLYRVADEADRSSVESEVVWQLQRFEEVVGAPPSHLDSHQHVHRRSPVLAVMLRWARQLNVPLREMTPGVQYCGDFYGQTAEGQTLPEGVSVDALLSTLDALRPGITELGCHPGDPKAGELVSSYRLERALEVAALSDSRVTERVAALGIRLCSFREACVLLNSKLSSLPPAPK
jgi:predicted glycoside hydrolase/deacetylase ChbG (UPF0249 family)